MNNSLVLYECEVCHEVFFKKEIREWKSKDGKTEKLLCKSCKHIFVMAEKEASKEALERECIVRGNIGGNIKIL